ncbi:chemotaxis protein CheW [Picosynechococcus sp. NKBG15041c]|uniref:chemotaxis protein CheW n=1 Tax=Picosynechococcus sp. NKBG15041c TaxID=1407650 RepID=UPI000418FBE6|nr:chemotaxis protein CheW [Picosynechococcus sp. NKBG15041c]
MGGTTPIATDLASTTVRLQRLLPQLFQPEEKTGDRYLKFEFSPQQSGLISLEYVHEALRVPTRLVTPIPNMPDSVVGFMNSRNQVFFVVDLAQMLQLPATTANRQYYPVVTVRQSAASQAQDVYLNQTDEDTSLLGLVVHAIQGVIRLNAEEIASPIEEFSEELTPYLKGCFVQDGQSVPVLDVQAIATAKTLAAPGYAVTS